MNWDKQLDLVKQAKVPYDHPFFLQRIFSLVAGKKREENALDADNLKKSCSEEYDRLSQGIERARIQESSSVRNVLRTRRLANLLIDDKGELNSQALPRLIKALKENLYSLGPERQHDQKGQKQILSVLQALAEKKELVQLLKKISKPYSHKQGEQMVRDTLQLPPNTMITDAHARRAALSAWMCTLRQSVGSCFATAPAIIIHDELPELFLKDLNELLSTGRLKRTFGGDEYSVPFSVSWGIGDLGRQFTLPRELDRAETPLWESPSVIQAFQAVGLISDALPDEQKAPAIKLLIQTAFASQHVIEYAILTSAEEIFRHVLMQELSITEEDLEDYENRPKFMLFSNLVARVPKATKDMRSKGDACGAFLVQLEVMKNSFKAYAENALLKAWEFSLASFAESKANFTRWNLYTSLGLGSEEKGGIGQALYTIIKEKLEQCNAKVQELQLEYEQIYSQVQMLSERFKRAESESDAKWMKSEYQAKLNEFHTFEEMRNAMHAKARRYANLYNVLIDFFDKKFPEYFQEVYDADMHEVKAGPYDDSPAGFRLLFRQVRSLTVPGVPIRNANQFIESLVTFFNSIENELVSDSAMEGMEKDLSEIFTAVVMQLRSQEFIETAFARIAIAHQAPIIKNPLENLDKIEKKPWAYTSGGTMGTLVSCYFKREQQPSQTMRWVENETELAVYLIDTLKQLPHQILKEYGEDTRKSLLMHSPSHAFLLKPASSALREGWQSEAFTYTWLRDQVIHPMKKFVDEIILDQGMMQHLIEKVKELIPLDFQHRFTSVFSHMSGKMIPSDFRDHLLETLATDRGLRFSNGGVLADQIDHVLAVQLPLFPSYELPERLLRVVELLPGFTPPASAALLNLFDQIAGSVAIPHLMGPPDLKAILLALICLTQWTTSTSVDYPLHITTAMRKLGFAMPAPFIFADTNWVNNEFGFIYNPGTERFELWRLDYIGGNGMPMSSWKIWLNGSRKEPTWGVYSKPYEYKG